MEGEKINIFITRFTVKLLSYDRTNALLENMTSGEHTMPGDLQGFSLERIRRVRIWMNVIKLGYLCGAL